MLQQRRSVSGWLVDCPSASALSCCRCSGRPRVNEEVACLSYPTPERQGSRVLVEFCPRKAGDCMLGPSSPRPPRPQTSRNLQEPSGSSVPSESLLAPNRRHLGNFNILAYECWVFLGISKVYTGGVPFFSKQVNSSSLLHTGVPFEK
jgi:hypothetical protein